MNGVQLLLPLALAGSLSASFIPIGAIPNSGPGLGTIETVLTIQSPGASTNATGCVAAGISGLEITGSGACPAGFSGGNEIGTNDVFSVASLGLTSADQFQLVAIPNEPAVFGQTGITFNSIAVTLWDPSDGSILETFYTAAPLVLASSDPGSGNAGFGFELDAVQAANFNAILAAFPTAYIGAAANVSNAEGSPDVIAIRVNDAVATPVPEPSAFLLLSGALPLIVYLRCRRRAS